MHNDMKISLLCLDKSLKQAYPWHCCTDSFVTRRLDHITRIMFLLLLSSEPVCSFPRLTLARCHMHMIAISAMILRPTIHASAPWIEHSQILYYTSMAYAITSIILWLELIVSHRSPFFTFSARNVSVLLCALMSGKFGLALAITSQEPISQATCSLQHVECN